MRENKFIVRYNFLWRFSLNENEFFNVHESQEGFAVIE